MKNLIHFLFIFIALVFLYTGCNQDDTSTGSNNTVTNKVPDKPKNPYPADSSENIDTNVIMVLTWQCSDPDPNDTVKYDLYASNDLPIGTTPIVTDLSNPSYGLGILSASTNYYWKVVARDNHGGSSTSNVWRFRTKNRQ